MAHWDFLATSLTGAALGELRNISDRQVTLGINRVPMMQGRVRVDDALADTLLSGQALLKAYRNGTLIFNGPVIPSEEVNDAGNGTVAFAAAGPLWRLGHRHLGKSAAGYSHGTSVAPVDRSTILAGILTAVNGDAYTGIDVGTVTASTTSYVAWAPYKPALEAVNEVATPLGGPDYEVAPTEPLTTGAGTRIGVLNVSASIGQARPAAAFEAGPGTRSNVASWRRAVSLDGLANVVYVLPPSSDPAAAVAVATDAPSIAAYGRHELVIASELASADMRQRIADENVRLRRVPRQTITFTPTRDDPATPGRVPQFMQDFVLGDTVPFRAVIGRPDGTVQVRVNASLRVYGIAFALDPEGAETPTVTLTPD
jgi:hypothetical protein